MKSFLIYIYKYFKITKLFYVGLILTAALNYLFIFFNNKYDMGRNSPIVVGVTALSLIIIPSYFIINFLANCFNGNTTTKRIIFISHSYLGLIVLFASLYFLCCYVEDYNDEVSKYFYYKAESQINNLSPSEHKIFRLADSRAFKGINKRLWTGPDNPDEEMLAKISSPKFDLFYRDKFINKEIEEVPINICLEIANQNREDEFLKLINQNVVEVYVDCLYFSTVTITTIGYGDITPSSFWTKILAMIEVVSGLVILGFALNIAFLNWKK